MPVLTGRMTRGIAMNSQGNRSIPELFSDAVGQLAKLIGNEFELARAELSEKASVAARACGNDRRGRDDSDTGAGAAVAGGLGSVGAQRPVGAGCVFVDRCRRRGGVRGR